MNDKTIKESWVHSIVSGLQTTFAELGFQKKESLNLCA